MKLKKPPKNKNFGGFIVFADNLLTDFPPHQIEKCKCTVCGQPLKLNDYASGVLKGPSEWYCGKCVVDNPSIYDSVLFELKRGKVNPRNARRAVLGTISGHAKMFHV